MLFRSHAENPPLPDARVLEQLCLYDWPLNVREMVSLVRRIAATHPNAKSLSLGQLRALLPELAAPERASAAKPGEATSRRRADRRAFTPSEHAALQTALERHGGHVASAAAELGVSRQRVYRMLKK